ncbi:MAG: T9SS type A sorting domain-containing protein [Bacteroidota bacterium]
MRISLSLCLAALFTVCLTPAVAQDATRQIPDTPRNSEINAPDVLHITDRLAQTPAAREALQVFQANKQTATQKAGTTAIRQSLGDRATFRVMKNVATNPSWEEKSFTLSATSAVANIWVEDGELSLGNVSDADIVALEDALLLSTPAASVDPARGIVENNNFYFGNPPNIDGDGQLDILLYDISEGGSNNNFFVAGFVTPEDLSPTGNGNFKDILYLDTNPGISSRPITSVLATAAHEYQHLIHYNYDLFEQTFINEGLSEWAEVMNGYPSRTMSFLSDPATYNIRLLEWESGDNILLDYQRAGLFTGYLAERMSPEALGAITRNPNRGRRGYEEIINQQGLDFEELLKDYHTANLLNNGSLDPAFQYLNPTYANIGTIPTTEVDGQFATETPTTTTFIEAGAVSYLVWDNVADFVLNMDTIDPFDALRARIAVRVLLEKANGETSFEDLPLPLEETYYAGDYASLTLIVTHVKAELTSRVGLTYNAQWGTPVNGIATAVQFDNGQVASDGFFSLGSDADGAVATRFDVPDGGQSTLQEVSLSPYFVNQFNNSTVPDDAPRDLTLKVWETGSDGRPGAEIFSLAVTDPRTTGISSSALNHFSVDLTPYQDQLSNLPATIFIGYAEAGNDPNYMVVGASTYATEDRSFVVLSDGNWGALWDIQFSDSGAQEFPLQNTVVPVRALFVTTSLPVAIDDEVLADNRFELATNFPNPFQSQTTIPYTLPTASAVKLVVYNVLGQEVQTLIDQFQPAGNYSVTFQADSLPSGLYLYTLEAGSNRQTRRMTVVH